MNEQAAPESEDDDAMEDIVAMEILHLLQEADEDGACPETFADTPFRVEPGYDPGTFDVHLLDGSIFAVEVTRLRGPKKSKAE